VAPEQVRGKVRATASCHESPPLRGRERHLYVFDSFFCPKMKTRLVFNDYIIYIQIMADKYKIPYVNMCIRLFARRFQMTLQGAADYLCKFKGIRFLDDCYPSEHLLPVEDALDDLVAVCKNNGGAIG
jgi:hypothetical protein